VIYIAPKYTTCSHAHLCAALTFFAEYGVKKRHNRCLESALLGNSVSSRSYQSSALHQSKTILGISITILSIVVKGISCMIMIEDKVRRQRA